MFELDYVTNLIKETFFFLLRKPEVLSGNQFWTNQAKVNPGHKKKKVHISFLCGISGTSNPLIEFLRTISKESNKGVSIDDSKNFDTCVCKEYSQYIT